MSKVIPKVNLSEDEKKHLPVLKNTDQVAEIHLSGTAILEDGTMTKHKFFEFIKMDVDDYSDISYTPEEALKIKGHLSRMSTGSTAMVPMICSPVCPFRARCVFYGMGKAPYGRACLVETNLLNIYVTKYFNQYEVDPNNFTEIGIINELAEIEIYLWRLNQVLARVENVELISESIVGFTHPSQGSEPLREKKISPYLEVKERMFSRRSKLVKLMVGDRQEKYKKEAALHQREVQDPSSSMADLRRKLENLQADLDKETLKMKEASGQVIEATAVGSQATTEDNKPKEVSPEDLMYGDNQ